MTDGEQTVAGGHVLGIRARTEQGLHEIGRLRHVEERTSAERVVQRVVELAEVVEDLRGEGGGVRSQIWWAHG